MKDQGLPSNSHHNQNCSSFGQSKMGIPPVSTDLTSNVPSKKAAEKRSLSLSEPSTPCLNDYAKEDMSPLSKEMLRQVEETDNIIISLVPEVKLSISLTSSLPGSEAGNPSLSPEEEKEIFDQALNSSFLIRKVSYPLCQIMGKDEVEKLRWRLDDRKENMLDSQSYSKIEILFWDFLNLIDIIFRWIKSLLFD
jgi:hypothetical protein